MLRNNMRGLKEPTARVWRVIERVCIDGEDKQTVLNEVFGGFDIDGTRSFGIPRGSSRHVGSDEPAESLLRDAIDALTGKNVSA